MSALPTTLFLGLWIAVFDDPETVLRNRNQVEDQERDTRNPKFQKKEPRSEERGPVER
jgi:hypothetical protein